jgi:hypothetical protein
VSFLAQYDGTCKRCGGRFSAGALIRAGVAGGYEHVDCPDDPSVSLRPSEEVCSRCFLVKPCECDDERKES